ncbi:MAG: hypothetical protein JWO90_2039 [Solirubrobacterales bacterium]|nr:hypothetical protein [Solirubrobacterales bacterium]
MQPRATCLLERAFERQSLAAAWGAARRGEGEVVLITGPVGIGKTALLRAGLADARAAGLPTYLARASEPEGSLAFSVVRQLFESALAHRSTPERDLLFAGAAELAREALEPPGVAAARTPDADFSMVDALYRLCVNLAGQGPLVLAVDDLQWADPASQRWIAYLARRIDALPVLLVVSLRTESRPAARVAELELSALEGARILRPAPLGVDAVRTIIQEVLGPDPAEEFVRAAHDATRGNPLFLAELLEGLRHKGVRPAAEEAGSVEEIGPLAVARLLRARLRSLGPAAERLAQAAAVIGDGADTALLRDLAELETASFAEAAERLSGADLVRVEPEVEFVHPIVRAAIKVSLSTAERGLLSRRAATLLTARGEFERVAGHLLSVPPSSDAEVVSTLRAAAARVLARGAPGAAVELLLRAVLEPPDPVDEADVLHELALAELRTHASIAPVHLAAALERTPAGAARSQRAGDLARALQTMHRPHEALRIAEQALPTSTGPDRDRLAARIVELARFLPGSEDLEHRVASAVDAIEAPASVARMRAVRAYDAMLAGTPAGEVAAQAREALAAGSLTTDTSEGSVPALLACIALAAAGDTRSADGDLDRLLVTARRRGSVVSLTGALSVRARLRLVRGDLRGSEADAVEVLERGDEGLGRHYSCGWLVESLVEQGRLEEAEKAVRRGILSGEVPELTALNAGLHARGRLRIAEGRIEEGLRDVLTCATRQERVGARNPADVPWRGTAALALLALGRSEQARAMSAAHSVLAEGFGAPAVVGAALRVRALVVGGPEAHELLERAVGLLDGAPAHLELARARLALGRARQATGDGEGARREFALVRELAEELGAKPLEAEAMGALLAAGGRPRRPHARGRAALTPAERRIAEQAARGRSNREIAESLFVTEKTVEGHLRNSFRKLEVTSRSQLAVVFGGG